MIAILLGLLLTQLVEGAQVSSRVPLYTGNPVSKQLLGSVTVQATAGDVFLVVVHAETEPAYWPGCTYAALIPYAHAVTSALYAFQGAAPLTATVANGMTAPTGGLTVANTQGRDVSVAESDYYSPISRPGLYQATQDGPVTFGFYMWGYSTDAKPGDAACIFPGTFRIQAVRL